MRSHAAPLRLRLGIISAGITDQSSRAGASFSAEGNPLLSGRQKKMMAEERENEAEGRGEGLSRVLGGGEAEI